MGWLFIFSAMDRHEAKRKDSILLYLAQCHGVNHPVSDVHLAIDLNLGPDDLRSLSHDLHQDGYIRIRKQECRLTSAGLLFLAQKGGYFNAFLRHAHHWQYQPLLQAG